MQTFIEKKFTIPALKGISAKTVEEHLKLYAGYVKNANEIIATGQYDRRFPFEFNGMRNHELYFSHFEGGSTTLTTSGPLHKAIEEEWGSFDLWFNNFKALALTRGVGWVMLVWDPASKQLLNNWVDEQHLGQLSACIPVLALDMWEHSFVADYQPSGKKNYVEDFFANLNWGNVETNYTNAIK
jgi:Fe-Mn family superoxide dismutase